MLKEFKERVQKLRQDLIEAISRKKLPKEVSIRCDDPYDPEQPAVEIGQIRKEGVVTEEYEGAIAFNQWSVETLLCILEEIG